MIYRATGIVLAGGRSSRMGTDKARMPYRNRTFLSHTLEKLQGLFEEVLLIVSLPGRYELSGVREVADIYRDRGPLGGIHAGLSAAGFDRAFVIACDMPHADVETIETIMDSGEGYDAAVPVNAGRPEPLFAFYGKSCLPAIEYCLEQNIMKVAGFYPHVRVKYLDIVEFGDSRKAARSLVNINTPEDYARIALYGTNE